MSVHCNYDKIAKSVRTMIVLSEISLKKYKINKITMNMAVFKLSYN